MTKNQIEYNKILETRRANMANEDITRKRDQATRELGLDTIRETARHNQQVELQARDNLAEQYRNNLAQLQELQRSHLVSEGIAEKNAETQAQQQVETKRHNLTSEDLTEMATLISRMGAELGAESRVAAAGISAAAAQYASDNVLLAKNLDIDLGNRRLATELGLQTARLSEDKRKAFASQAEINRSNRMSEQIRAGQLGETARHNLSTEFQNLHRINSDVALRQQQNAVAAQVAGIQQRRLDLDIALAPSQKFEKTTRGIQSLANSIGSVVNTFKKGK